MDPRELAERLAVPPQRRTEALGERHELDLLRWHWGGFYDVAVNGTWTARRRDDATVLTAASGTELRLLIREDFDTRPVPRHCAR